MPEQQLAAAGEPFCVFEAATLFEEGLVKASEGLTTLEEVMRCLPLVLKPRPLEETRRLLGV